MIRYSTICLLALISFGCAPAATHTSEGERIKFEKVDDSLLRGRHAWSDSVWEAHLAKSANEDYVLIAEAVNMRIVNLDARTALMKHRIPSRFTVINRQHVQLYVPPKDRIRAMRVLEDDLSSRHYWLILK
jgi:hypothetical protein